MFSFGGFSTGKSTHPPIYTKSTKDLSPTLTTTTSTTSTSTTESISSSIDSLEPAIDGPPSPEHIRAYTEQMKRSSIFGNNSRSNTLSSGASSSRSRDSISVSASTESLSLSRKSSSRSNASSMPPSRLERPESVQIFGRSLFSRRGRRVTRQDREALNGSPSSITPGDGIREEASRRIGQDERSRRGTMTSSRSPALLPEEHRSRHAISGPFNFQHVTHTGQNHIPDLEKASHSELVSEFSTIRATQSPLNGELKGIQAQDLHFENFSSESLGSPKEPEEFPIRPRSKHRRNGGGLLRKTAAPPRPQRPISYAKSHDNFRSSPPPRPPRSPLSPTSPPVDLPARTSSRSISINDFDPLVAANLAQHQNSGGFRRPAPIGLSTQTQPDFHEQENAVATQPMSHALSTPVDEAWPLTASSANFGELADVQEEDEEAVKRRSKMSTASGELRMSQSVPALRLRTLVEPNDDEAPMAVTVLHRTTALRQPLSPGFHYPHDSWTDAIDYAYEHEAEADCDYQWDRCSVDDDSRTIAEAPQSTAEQSQPQPELELHLNDEQSSYHGRFRPSLLVPSALDIPELSPMSNTSTFSDPRTPSNFLQPGHFRSPSHASSFKESHGFSLSPSLLIPSDFQSQIDQDTLYEEHYNDQNVSASLFVQESYSNSLSPADDSISSTTSHRSSDFSRGSARSSSSTRISHTNSRSSQDSMVLSTRIMSISQEHRSFGSASSLPDLVPSTNHVQDADLSRSVGCLKLEEEDGSESGSTSAGLFLGSKSPTTRKGVNHFAPPSPVIEDEHMPLSPVAELSNDVLPMSHGRKVSAPVASMTVKEFKGRARSATQTSGGVARKQRSSYMLFPQI
jgi:hypothetical protein